jgi:hypothetical protein
MDLHRTYLPANAPDGIIVPTTVKWRDNPSSPCPKFSPEILNITVLRSVQGETHVIASHATPYGELDLGRLTIRGKRLSVAIV